MISFFNMNALLWRHGGYEMKKEKKTLGPTKMFLHWLAIYIRISELRIPSIMVKYTKNTLHHGPAHGASNVIICVDPSFCKVYQFTYMYIYRYTKNKHISVLDIYLYVWHASGNIIMIQIYIYIYLHLV